MSGECFLQDEVERGSKVEFVRPQSPRGSAEFHRDFSAVSVLPRGLCGRTISTFLPSLALQNLCILKTSQPDLLLPKTTTVDRNWLVTNSPINYPYSCYAGLAQTIPSSIEAR